MAASVQLVWLAHLWDTEGYGLNPWIALPVATLFMLLPYLYAELVDWLEDRRIQRELYDADLPWEDDEMHH
jgi:hypothetical protein